MIGPGFADAVGVITIRRIAAFALAVALLAFVAGSLAGCATPPTSISALPPVREYSPEFTARFADQLATIPSDSPVAVYVVDSQALRCAVRAARGDALPETCKP